MPSTNKTPYAELPQFLPSDKPTWLGDMNNAFLKIDGKLSEANTKNTQQDLQIATALENSANADKAAQAAQNAAEGAVAKADAVSARLPVGSADIKDGAVTATKLDSTAMNAILKGMTIKKFNSANSAADNDGLIAPPGGGKIEGFYFVEIGLLVITEFSGKGECPYTAGQTTARLPNYVQRPQSNKQIGIALRYVDGTDFKTWSGFGINSAGGIGLNTSSTGDSFALMGAQAFLVGASQGRVIAGDYAATYNGENGLIDG